MDKGNQVEGTSNEFALNTDGEDFSKGWVDARIDWLAWVCVFEV